MTEETAQLFDAPWKVDKVDFKSDIFGVGSTILRIFDKTEELITAHIPDEKTANRLSHLPELYDALKGAVQEACGTCAMMHVNPDTYDFVEKGCPFIGEHHCDYRDCIAILRKVRDGE